METFAPATPTDRPSPPAMGGSAGPAGRAIRSDARENRERLLRAARDLFVEQGPGVALDEIARRAGCGIATLYRRFPDRQALIRAVVADALTHTIEAAQTAAREEPDPFDALVRYMHVVLDLRTSAVIPALLPVLSMTEDPHQADAHHPTHDRELSDLREQGGRALEDLIEAAQRSGGLRADVTFGDIGTLVVRVSHPLPGAFTREQNDALGHRHLDLVVDGLRASHARPTTLSGTALSRDDLHRLPHVDPSMEVTP